MNIFDHIPPSSFWNEKWFWTKVLDKIKTHFMFNNSLSLAVFFYCTIYEMMWKIIVGPGRQQMTVWCMCIAYWVTKATNTHSEYAILNDFLLYQWLHDRASVLHYIYKYCLSC